MQYERFDPSLKAVGANIRRLRKEAKLSMETVAHTTQIEYRILGKIERGEGNTTIVSLLRIAEVLNVDVMLFFDRMPLSSNANAGPIY